MVLASAFSAGLGALARRELAQAPAPDFEQHLEQHLEAILRQARESWSSSFEVPAERFMQHLAGRLPRGTPALDALGRMHTTDLYLACGCALGDDAAIQACDAHCQPALATVLAKLRVPAHQADELVQELRARLFVALPDRPPVIAQYSGRGRLAEWIRVACLRTVLKQRARPSKEIPIEDEILADTPAADSDPELRLLKESYRAEFRDAFREALEALTQRQRSLLRQHFFRQLTVDRLGAMFGVHRSTAARWLAEARQELLQKTRTALSHRLGLDDSEWESVMRLIESRLDVSFRALVER